MLRKDHSTLIAKIKDTWYGSAITFNDVVHVKEQVIDEILALIPDVIDVMRWDI